MAIADDGVVDRSPRPLRSAFGRLLLIPRVAWLGARTPRDLLVGWNHYWSSIRRTGVGGDVLWDTAELDEMPEYLATMKAQLDLDLPIIDVGCGNGSFTRQLASYFPRVIGVDLSPEAVALAARECDVPQVEFRTLDITVPGATVGIAEELGPVNVFVRGVLHILSPAARAEMARNLLPLLGSRGRLFLSETNFRGSGLGYLEWLGATARSIPEPLERAIKDLPRPGHFGAEERAATFPGTDWTVLLDGPSVIETIPLRGPTEPERIPGYFAVMEPRQG
jgi:SAM-dependent methyltransferase